MRITLESAGFFADVMSIISELVSEVKMKFNSEGLHVIAIDPTNAAMLLFKLPKESFSHYEVEKEEVIGINLDDFKQVLRRGKQESLSLETKESRLLVNFGENKKSFILSLIDMEGEERKEPELKFAANLKLDSSKLQEAVEDCSIVSDSILFSIGEKGFVLDAKSSLHSASINLLKEAFQQDVKSRYSLDYLQKMVKSSKLSDNVSIQFSNEYPLRLHYITPQKAELSFILAPRVETD